MILKLKLIFLIFAFGQSTYGQTIIPCIDKKTNLDMECKCKKRKSCMSSMSPREKKSLVKLNQEIPGNYIMKITKKSLPGLMLMKKALSGEFDVNNFPYKEFNKIDEEFTKMNKGLIKKAEEKMKELKVKPFKVKERIAIFEKKDKKLYDKYAKPKKNITLAGMKISSNGIKEETDEVIKEVAEETGAVAIAENQPDSQNNNGLAYKDMSGKVQKYMKKKFKYKGSILNKDANIFKNISARYVLKMKDLDQKTIQLAINQLNDEDIKDYFKAKLLKIYRY